MKYKYTDIVQEFNCVDPCLSKFPSFFFETVRLFRCFVRALVGAWFWRFSGGLPGRARKQFWTGGGAAKIDHNRTPRNVQQMFTADNWNHLNAFSRPAHVANDLPWPSAV